MVTGAADAKNSQLVLDNSYSWQPYLQHLHGADVNDGKEGLPSPNYPAMPTSPFDMPPECLWSDFSYPDSPIHASAEIHLDSADGMDMFMSEESIRLNNLSCFGTHMFDSETKALVEEEGGGSPPCKRQQELQFSGGHTEKSELKKSCGTNSFIDPNVNNDFSFPQSISCESMWLIANESYMDDIVFQIPTDHSFGATMCSNEPYTRSTDDKHIRESFLVSGEDGNNNDNGNGNVVSDLISLCHPTKSTLATTTTTSSATSINPSKTKLSSSSSSSTSSMPSTSSTSSTSTSSTMAVVYPFAVVKPSWVQGHITLKDINDRILSPTTRVFEDLHDHHSSKRPRSMKNLLSPGIVVSSIKRKSVVALTRIHTEGNGSITIVRTKD